MLRFITWVIYNLRLRIQLVIVMSEKITQVAVSSKFNEWKWKSYISNADRSKKFSKKTHGN